MSVSQQLRNSGMFYEHAAQVNGTVCFTVSPDNSPRQGPSIYVLSNDDTFEIRVRALIRSHFPNSARLHLFALDNAIGTNYRFVADPNYSYHFAGQHIDNVISIIREGLQL